MAGGLPALDAVHSFQLRAGPYQAHTVGPGLRPPPPESARGAGGHKGRPYRTR